MRKSPNKTKYKMPVQKYPIVNSPQIQKILALRDNFKKNIETPIQNIQSIQRSKTPQRCLIHNTILTLYCQLDRKALCANCMYQQQTHRKHRVIPLSRAMNLVKQDILGYEIKLQTNLSQCSAFSRKLQQMVIKSQRYYPSVIKQLRQYYVNMIEMLKQKENEQIKQIIQQQQKMKKQIVALDQQVKRIAAFINCKLTPNKKYETQDLVLTRRGILQVLTKVNKNINHDITEIFEEDQVKKIIDFNLYQDIYQMAKNRLIVILPGISIQPRKNLSTSFSSRSLVPKVNINNTNVSPNKKSYQKSPVKARSVSNKKQDRQKKQVTFNLN